MSFFLFLFFFFFFKQKKENKNKYGFVGSEVFKKEKDALFHARVQCQACPEAEKKKKKKKKKYSA
eukprot:NODE_30951_length_407_cov_0.864286.p1 GENE.NODE_30951_length_407_cov_0.864286~~NODE_30951_length_407_cov_0.864286.p1  ORF type:complete len:65 (+),score=25.91 NODE_30951_length_407_cov_0.864286:53-247(+)